MSTCYIIFDIIFTINVQEKRKKCLRFLYLAQIIPKEKQLFKNNDYFF